MLGRKVVAGLALGLALAAAVPAAAGARAAVPPPTTFPQDSGELVTGVPTTPACTQTITADHAFLNTAYGPDQPFHAVSTPPAACPGPWSKVVLTMGVSVSGTQFDRTGDVTIGGVEVLRTSTEEPTLTGTATWTVRKDVTEYGALLAAAQPVVFNIANVVTSTYDGVYHGSLALTYWSAGSRVVPHEPDAVIGGAQGYVSAPAAHVDLVTALPQNLVALRAELFADGHGACDEFWWSEVPGASSCGGAPCREVAVRVDGRLAGVAPVFPDLFTGADGPDYWHPIPAPRAFDLRPYAVDLTPFAGGLTDGLPHTFSVSVLDWTEHPGDNWFLGVNLLANLNHASGDRTTGSVVRYSVPSRPVDRVNTGTLSVAETRFSAAHALSIAGVESIPGAGDRTVEVDESMHETSTQTVPVQDAWTWTARTTTSPAGHEPTVRTLSAQYALTFGLVHFAVHDAYTDTLAAPHAAAVWTRLDDRMETTAEFPGIVGLGGVSSESWQQWNSAGACADHELVAAFQVFVVDSIAGSGCGSPTGAA